MWSGDLVSHFSIAFIVVESYEDQIKGFVLIFVWFFYAAWVRSVLFPTLAVLLEG
jgi:hypothetical protein